jgi:hypothetical protein
MLELQEGSTGKFMCHDKLLTIMEYCLIGGGDVTITVKMKSDFIPISVTFYGVRIDPTSGAVTLSGLYKADSETPWHFLCHMVNRKSKGGGIVFSKKEVVLDFVPIPPASF